MYIQSIGYKTYAHFYYAKVTPSTKPFVTDSNDPQQNWEWEQWLLKGDIDKPAYFSTKNTHYQIFNEYPGIDSLYAKNGFVFYMREVPN